MMIHFRIAPAALVVAIELFSRRAHACSRSPCSEGWAAPDNGTSVPANVPGLLLAVGGGSTPPRLAAADGTAIPFNVSGGWLRPTAPLPVGEATLRFGEPCSFDPDAGIVERAIKFTVTPSTPLPTRLGSVSTTYAYEKVEVVTGAGSCTDFVESAVASLHFDLDPALRAYRSVTAFETTVDGKLWGGSVYGRETPYAGSSYASMEHGWHRYDRVFAACGPSPRGTADRGVATGRHHVEVRAIVADTPALPALAVDIELACDGSGEATADAGGCTASSRTPSSFGVAWLALLAALARRTRRS